MLAPHCLNLRTLLRFVAPSSASHTSDGYVHMSSYSHHRDLKILLVNILHMVYLLKRHRCDFVYVQLSQSRTHSHLSVPPMWEHILRAQLLPTREVLVPPLREPTILSIQILVQGLALFLNREPSFFLWSTLVNLNLMGTVTLIQPTVISCIINSFSPFFNGIQDRPAGTQPISLRLLVASFMQFFFKKPVIIFRTSLSSSLCAPATRTSPSCSLKTPLSLTQKFSHTRLTPQAKVRGVWSYSLSEAYWRRPSLSGTPTVTFCSVHIHNVVAKKRDASTDVLQRLHGYMKQHNVDFIGGDFSMSAFSTVGDVFTDAEFSALGNSFLWGLGALEEPNRECAGFLIMPKRPYEWRVHSHGCYKFDTAALGLGPRDQSAHLPVFLHLRTTNLPGVMRSEQTFMIALLSAKVM